jgi:hypothetical protein
MPYLASKLESLYKSNYLFSVHDSLCLLLFPSAMMYSWHQLLPSFVLKLLSVCYLFSVDQDSPQAQLDNATVTGFFSGNTATYLGIPFALPP